MKTVALIPIKLNNERTPGKNTKAFYDGTPLVHFIQKSLLNCKGVDEAYIYCSNDVIREYMLPGVCYRKRDERFDVSTVNVNDMFYAFAKEMAA